MTCKEGIVQARRLAGIIRAQLDGLSAPAHTSFPPFFCIGLGPKDGFVWTRKWGLDFVLTGQLGRKVREYTWNMASLMK
jgi:NADH dehydrogenase